MFRAESWMPPRRKRTNSQSGITSTAAAKTDAPQKRPKRGASTVEWIFGELVRTIGSATEFETGLPVTQLLRIIAGYAGSFDTVKTVWEVSGISGLPLRPLYADSEAVIVEDLTCIYRVSRGGGAAKLLLASTDLGEPQAMCRDPLNSTGYYIAYSFGVHYFDEAKNKLTPFVGGGVRGPIDGVGADAGFHLINSILITSDGATIWCGSQTGIRRIGTSNRRVTSHNVRSWTLLYCWDRAAGVEPDSAFYGPRASLQAALVRYRISVTDTGSGSGGGGGGVVVSGMLQFFSVPFAIKNVVSTSNGSLLLVEARGDTVMAFLPAMIHSFDPATGEIERIYGVDVDLRARLLVVDSTHTLITTNDGLLTTYSLPPKHFPLPKCLERDL